MNSGLPSLLDAIFGKQNLDSVSKEEIYELVNEFPSFNAGHFLLSKKLKNRMKRFMKKKLCERHCISIIHFGWNLL